MTTMGRRGKDIIYNIPVIILLSGTKKKNCFALSTYIIRIFNNAAVLRHKILNKKKKKNYDVELIFSPTALHICAYRRLNMLSCKFFDRKFFSVTKVLVTHGTLSDDVNNIFAVATRPRCECRDYIWTNGYVIRARLINY